MKIELSEEKVNYLLTIITRYGSQNMHDSENSDKLFDEIDVQVKDYWKH